MKPNLFKQLATALALTVLWASIGSAAELAGVQLDDPVGVNGTQLVLNGAGLRTKFGAKVYVAALYVTAKTSDAEKIINADAPRRMRLVMKRTVAADTMWGAFQEGIEAHCTAEELKALQPKMAAMDKAFNQMGKTVEGDVLDFDFAADGTTTFTVNGKVKETIPGKDLSSALLKVWLGAKPAQEPLKKDLLKGQ